MAIEYSCATSRWEDTSEEATVVEVEWLAPHSYEWDGETRTVPERWVARVVRIDAEWRSSCQEFFDTREDAVAYAESLDPELIVVAGKGEGPLFGDLSFARGERLTDLLYFEHARKMDVKVYEDGVLEIYNDLAYTGANNRCVRLSKEQCMWLMRFLGEAMRAMPVYGWESDVERDMDRREM